MSRLPLIACTTALTIAVAACTPTTGMEKAAVTDDRATRQCFFADQIRNFRSTNQAQLYVRSNRNEVFELNSSGGCFDVENATRIAITQDVGGLGGGRVCTGDWARLTVPSSTSAGPTTCRVRIERRLTDEQVAALPSRSRP